MRGKEHENAACRDHLLRAGKRLFARDGFDKTTVRDIAAEAGVNVSMVSYYFDGKEGLYRACLEEFGSAKLKDVGPLVEAPRSEEEFRVRLRMLVDFIFRYYTDETELPKIISREVEAGLPVARDVYEKTYLPFKRAIVAFIESAQKSGFVRDDIVPHAAAFSLHGSINFMFRAEPLSKRYWKVSMTDAAMRASFADTLTRIFIDGLSPQKRGD